MAKDKKKNKKKIKKQLLKIAGEDGILSASEAQNYADKKGLKIGKVNKLGTKAGLQVKNPITIEGFKDEGFDFKDSLDDGLKNQFGKEMSDLYKVINQEKATKVTKGLLDDVIIPTPTDEELNKRLDPLKKTQKKIDKFDKNFGDRIKGNELKFSADGKKLKKLTKPPEFEKLGGDNLKAAQSKMASFEQGGGFKSKPMTTKTANKLKSKGKDLLNRFKV